jgi:hypothetical protein
LDPWPTIEEGPPEEVVITPQQTSRP